jgi:hypothetical protein
MKVSEVFDLPAYSFGRIVADNLSAGGVGSFDSADMAKFAAHAINHVDALADALERIVMNAEDSAFESWIDKNHPSGDVSEVQYKFERSAEFKDFIEEFEIARKVLAAYRGKP